MTDLTAKIGPGVLAFIVFFALAIALWFLMRSMTKHLRTMSNVQRRRAAAEATPPARRTGTGRGADAVPDVVDPQALRHPGEGEPSGDGRQGE